MLRHAIAFARNPAMRCRRNSSPTNAREGCRDDRRAGLGERRWRLPCCRREHGIPSRCSTFWQAKVLRTVRTVRPLCHLTYRAASQRQLRDEQPVRAALDQTQGTPIRPGRAQPRLSRRRSALPEPATRSLPASRARLATGHSRRFPPTLPIAPETARSEVRLMSPPK